MAFCPKCGAVLPDNNICPNCNPQVQNAPPPPPGYSPPPPGYGAPPPPPVQNAYGAPPPPPYGSAGIPEAIVRSSVTCILLSLVTCGIYYMYWSWVTNKQINALAGYEVVSGGMIVLGWFCFPIAFYNWYKWDNALVDITNRRGIRYNSNFVLWLILSLFGVGPYVMIFQIQDTLNQAYGG